MEARGRVRSSARLSGEAAASRSTSSNSHGAPGRPAVDAAAAALRRARAAERAREVEDSPRVLREKCRRLARALRNAKHLVVYTGAGISTAADIPDYRGPHGVWTRLQRGETVGRVEVSRAQPTFTHMALTAMWARGLLKFVVSQNCDGLHLRSGLPRRALAELHGDMFAELCAACRRVYLRAFDTTERTARHAHGTRRLCHACGAELRDSIVHFGERGRAAWPLNWAGALRHAARADVVLCLGSSLKVLRRYPRLWRMHAPPRARPALYIVNLQWTPKDAVAELKINARCDVVMRQVARRLRLRVPRYRAECDPVLAHAEPLAAGEAHTTRRPLLPAPAPARAPAPSPPADLLSSPSASDSDEELPLRRLAERLRAPAPAPAPASAPPGRPRLPFVLNGNHSPRIEELSLKKEELRQKVQFLDNEEIVIRKDNEEFIGIEKVPFAPSRRCPSPIARFRPSNPRLPTLDDECFPNFQLSSRLDPPVARFPFSNCRPSSCDGISRSRDARFLPPDPDPDPAGPLPPRVAGPSSPLAPTSAPPGPEPPPGAGAGPSPPGPDPPRGAGAGPSPNGPDPSPPGPDPPPGVVAGPSPPGPDPPSGAGAGPSPPASLRPQLPKEESPGRPAPPATKTSPSTAKRPPPDLLRAFQVSMRSGEATILLRAQHAPAAAAGAGAPHALRAFRMLRPRAPPAPSPTHPPTGHAFGGKREDGPKEEKFFEKAEEFGYKRGEVNGKREENGIICIKKEEIDIKDRILEGKEAGEAGSDEGCGLGSRLRRLLELESSGDEAAGARALAAACIARAVLLCRAHLYPGLHTIIAPPAPAECAWCYRRHKARRCLWYGPPRCTPAEARATRARRLCACCGAGPPPAARGAGPPPPAGPPAADAEGGWYGKGYRKGRRRRR